MEKEALIVNGFVFPSEKEAQSALKEQKNIEIIRQRAPFSDSETAYELYTKLIDRNMFKTIVGYSFLYELRQHLITDFGYEEDELPVLILPRRMDKVSEIKQGVLETKLQKALLLKKRMAIVIAALVVMVIAMFVIAIINPNTGYINTENKILNKYAAWQEELERREQAVQEKETELNINVE